MTDTKLRELLVVIDDHYGRARSLEERRADTQIYIRAFRRHPGRDCGKGTVYGLYTVQIPEPADCGLVR